MGPWSNKFGKHSIVENFYSHVTYVVVDEHL